VRSLLSAICFAFASLATLSSSWPAVGRDLRPSSRTGVEGPADWMVLPWDRLGVKEESGAETGEKGLGGAVGRKDREKGRETERR
jgi:hypothetical protein